MKRQLSILLNLFLLLALSACRLTTTNPYPMPSGMVDVGGYELYYECSGQGSPTVILESGGTGDSSDWAAVIEGLEGTTRVCAYDRASLGRSDPVPGPRAFEEMTRDLQVLLENAHIGGPYIPVGWSMGGLLVRIFADQHPEEIVGVVLVDSAHPDMGLRLLACLPPELAGEPENIQYLRRYFIWMSDSELPSVTIDETVDIRPSMQQARAVSTLGNLPLVVIRQGSNIPGLGNDWGPLPTETEACLQQTWQDMQGELAGLSSNATLLAAQGGHMFPVNEPELVIQAIIDLVEQLR